MLKDNENIKKSEHKYRLTFIYNNGSSMWYEDYEQKYLLHIYYWFLTKKSPKYNIRYNDGMTIIIRSKIRRVEFRKIKINYTKKEGVSTLKR